MSNEITYGWNMGVENGEFKFPMRVFSGNIDQTGKGVYSAAPTITTADTEISIDGLTTFGTGWIVNLDSTNYIDVGPGVLSGTSYVIAPMLRLKAGESYPIRFVPGIQLRGQANTSSVQIWVVVFED